MGFKLIIKPGAENDLHEALEWYKEQTSQGLDIELFQEIKAVLDDICLAP